MANFWQTSDGKAVEKTNEFDAGKTPPMPENTKVLALVTEAGWVAANEKEDDQSDKIKIRWEVLSPPEYKGRIVIQKLKVDSEKATARDKAIKMLMAIDQNAGGKLSQLEGQPEDDDLMAALVNKQMILNLQVWEIGDASGNWVAAVSPKTVAKPKPKAEDEGATESEPEAEAEKPKRRPAAKPIESGTDSLDNSDIPF